MINRSSCHVHLVVVGGGDEVICPLFTSRIFRPNGYCRCLCLSVCLCPSVHLSICLWTLHFLHDNSSQGSNSTFSKSVPVAIWDALETWLLKISFSPPELWISGYYHPMYPFICSRPPCRWIAAGEPWWICRSMVLFMSLLRNGKWYLSHVWVFDLWYQDEWTEVNFDTIFPSQYWLNTLILYLNWRARQWRPSWKIFSFLPEASFGLWVLSLPASVCVSVRSSVSSVCAVITCLSAR